MAGQISASIFEGLIHPDWQFISAPLDRFIKATFGTKIDPNMLTADGEDLLTKLLQTVSIAFLGTIISSILTIPFAFFAAHTEEDKKETNKQKITFLGKLTLGFAIFAAAAEILALIFKGNVSKFLIFIAVLWLIEVILISFSNLISSLFKTTIFHSRSSNGKFILTAIRVFPEIVLALMFVKAVGPGPFAGVLAIAVHSIGMIGKLDSEVIENLDRGPNSAIIAAGGTNLQSLSIATFTDALPSFISASLYRFEIAVRSASILGMVAAGGIGTDLIFATSTRNWPRAGIILIGIVVMVTLIDMISGQLRKRLV